MNRLVVTLGNRPQEPARIVQQLQDQLHRLASLLEVPDTDLLKSLSDPCEPVPKVAHLLVQPLLRPVGIADQLQ
ncbi:hypothetical protein [Glycomyces halotolerans]